MEFISERHFISERQMINCMKVWNYLQKTLDLPLRTEIIRQGHGLMMKDEKDVFCGEI